MKKYLIMKKGLFFILMLFILFNVILSITVAFLLKYVIDAASTLNQTKLQQSILLSLLYVIAYFIISLICGILKANYKKTTLIYIKKELFQHIMHFNFQTFTNTNSGEYISILNNDIRMLEDNYFANFLDCFQNILVLLFALSSMFIISPYVAIIAILLSVFPLIIPSLFSNKLANLQDRYVKTLGVYNEKIKDFFSGFEVIKSFHAENKVAEVHEDINERCENCKLKLEKGTALVNTFGGVISLCVQFAIFIISGYFVLSGNLTIGAIVAITQLSGNIVVPLMALTQCSAKSKAVKPVCDKLLDLLEHNQASDIIPLKKETLNKTINFNDVSFSYDGTKQTLANINLTLEKGKKYAFVGGSGSGKSTLLKLLLGYYANYSGDILIDNQTLKNIGTDAIHSFASVIHQNTFVFDDTLKNNITLFNEYSPSAIEESIKKAGLNELISTSENGINTLTSEGGNRFSGGEKQRIAIARALIRESNLLVMDEATANLDNETAFHVEHSLLNISNLTCAVVTHRYNKSLLKMYDNIFVLKDGKIIESGSFDQLMDKKEYFYSLYCISN